MRIIADSGSTKTHWVLTGPEDLRKDFHSEGINPHFMEAATIESVAATAVPGEIRNEVTELVFYGAGCAGPDKCALVHSALQKVFPRARIATNSDLLAAAHALLGKAAGVACILGTGSNAAVYDGETFTQRITSLGYMLGDEGSGSYIGRRLLQACFRKEMPETLRDAFFARFDLSTAGLLENIYRRPFPNRYLASFAPFASAHSDDDFIRELIHSSFADFIRYQLDTLEFDKQMPVGFVGSVAFHFRDVLREELSRNNYNPGKILTEPMDALLDFYDQNLG
jgi:N-acetylglucosamine kinase-like BadF-type ATPase